MKAILMLFTIAALANGSSVSAAQTEQNMPHMHHSGRQGMKHTAAQGVKLEQKMDVANHSVTLRIGSVDLPAHKDHMEVRQAPDQIWVIPVDGWLVAYHPKLVDAAGNKEPGRLLHHAAFWNMDRPDFLCPNKEEHIFGAGSEMNDWAEVPGYGYRVKKGDRIRVETMYHNPTDTDYRETWLEVRIEYRDAPEVVENATTKSVYPMWMDVQECGRSAYDLKSGASVKMGRIPLRYAGTLLGVGGHMHDFGRRLVLADWANKEPIATLDAKLDDAGRMVSMPVVTFFDRGGYRIEKGRTLQVAATYDNPSGKILPDGAMGIVVGYFLPDNDRQMLGLRRSSRPKRGENPSQSAKTLGR